MQIIGNWLLMHGVLTVAVTAAIVFLILVNKKIRGDRYPGREWQPSYGLSEEAKRELDDAAHFNRWK